MANLIYTKYLDEVNKNNFDWETGVIRALLERSTSTYAPDKDHNFVSDLTNLVEITVASYSRLTIAGAAINKDDANDRVEMDHNNLAFGNLESGQIVKSVIWYVQIGGSDATPADDPLICRMDADSGTLLPVTLTGGAFNVNINVEGLIQALQP